MATDALSSISSIAAKVGVAAALVKSKSGLGTLSSLAAGTAAVGAVMAIKSAFETKDFKKKPIPAAAKDQETPEEAPKFKTFAGSKVYPAEMKYYTMFSFYKYERVTVDQPPMSQPVCVICLPMPSNLGETFAVDYDTPAMGPIVGAATDAAINAFRSGGGGVGELMNKLGTNTGAKAAEVAGAAAMTGIKQIAPGGETLGNIAAMASGVVPNPHLAVIFRNVGLRDHTFSYKFAPRSQDEMKILKEIIKQLKTSCLPGLTTATETLFTFPDTCSIQFMPNKEMPYKIKDCVMTNLSVNYAPQGSPAFFKTGDPVMVEISMTFKELSVFTRKDI